MLQFFVYRNRNPMLYDYSDQTLKSWEGEELEECRVKCNASWLNNRKGIVTYLQTVLGCYLPKEWIPFFSLYTKDS